MQGDREQVLITKENSAPLVGGQAVLEGVMMQNSDRIAVAVRRESDGIIVLEDIPLRRRFKRVDSVPILRGLFRLFNMLSIGFKALNISANLALGEEEQLGTATTVAIFGFAILLVIGGFIILPLYLSGRIQGIIDMHPMVYSLIEGIIRIGFFILYLFAISRLKDIKRVFQYHGAEHKVVHVYENRESLTVDNARKYTTIHPRCGTSFLMIVMIISILLFALIGSPIIWVRILSRILLLPLVAGISYELLRFSGKHYGRLWVQILIQPGLWLQRLTTGQPSDEMIEVAIAALNKVTTATDQ
jgi:uncharacterized protein YqhQ